MPKRVAHTPSIVNQRTPPIVNRPAQPTHPAGQPEEFLLELAQALHVYGIPSHRLEETLCSVAAELGLEAQFLVTPTSIITSVGDQQRLLRVDQGETHLERLTDLDRIMKDVRSGEMSVGDATALIRGFADRPPRYGPFTTVLAFTLASGTAALFFGGGWRESLGAAVIGGVIGCITVIAGGRTRLERLVPVVAGLVAAVGGHLFATQLEPMFAFVATLAGLIILIPGLTLTIAMSELAHHHLVSGTARLMGASITFLQLGFGAALGWKLTPFLGADHVGATQPEGLPSWVQWAALPLIAATFTVLFRAHPRDYVRILIGAFVGFAVARVGSDAMGPEVGMALGAWALGCVSTLLARASGGPAAVPLLPGLLLLVPGSLGLRSLQAFVGSDIPLGIESAFLMMILAISLVTGLFLANLTLRPRPI